MKKETAYRKPIFPAYYFLHVAASLFARLIFRPKILRNEIRKEKGAYVLLGNHECALDAILTTHLTRRRMTYVISRSFYDTLPFRKLFGGLRHIVKNQFQTSLADMFRMKNVIAAGVLALTPLSPILESPTLSPAFEMSFTALFGALAYKYFTRDPRLVPLPLILTLVLQFTLGLGYTVLIPISAVVTILFTYLLYRKGWIGE